MGHSHQHLPADQLSAVTGRRAKQVLVGFLAVVALCTVIGMVALWPSQAALDEVRAGASFTAPGVSYEKARINTITDCPATEVARPPQFRCIFAEVDVLSGPDAPMTTSFEILGPGAVAGLQPGDRIMAMRVPIEGNISYAYGGVQRNVVVAIMGLLFVVSVLAVARWRGFWALIGLVISVGVMAFFTVPALASGASGVAVGLTGSVAIIFVVLFVAHGVSFRTTAALVGTLLGLAISTALGAAAVWFGRLSGYLDEAEASLVAQVPAMNLRELMIAAIIIAGLGVLNDVTITQTSAVWELRAAAPQMTRRQLFQSGMRIGRDHIASTIYTIVFAYTGAALTTLLLVMLFNDRPVLDLLTTETFGGEVLRTLASATGLVLTVPITTALAALTVKPAAAGPDEPTAMAADTGEPAARALPAAGASVDERLDRIWHSGQANRLR